MNFREKQSEDLKMGSLWQLDMIGEPLELDIFCDVWEHQ